MSVRVLQEDSEDDEYEQGLNLTEIEMLLPRSEVEVHCKHLRDTFINACVDRTLAAEIFQCVSSLEYPPRIINIRPDGVGNFGSAWVDMKFGIIAGCLARHWVRVSDPRFGRDEFYVKEIETESSKEAEKKLNADGVDSFYEGILITIWPGVKKHCKQAWKSYPLWNEG